MIERDSEDQRTVVNTERLRRVIKLGGSLLTFESLGPTFRQWLSNQPPSLNLVVVGGGEQVEKIRQDQDVYGWSDEDCHVRALQAMGGTSHFAADVLQVPRTDDQKSALDWLRTQTVQSQAGRSPSQSKAIAMVFDLSLLALQDLTLPRNWDLTSDSLAAWLAQRWSIPELVLMKSRSAPADWTPKSGDFIDWVDPLFPKFAAGLRVDCVNLRALET